MKQGMKKTGNRVQGRVLLAMVSSLAAGIAAAAGPAATVLVASGGVKAVSADGTARELSRRSTVYAGDRLVTGSSARAQVKFTDGAIVSLKPRSELRIDQYAYEDGAASSVMSLIKGGFRTMTGAIGKMNKSAYKVNTPVATIGIRGTVYEADFDPESGLGMGVWDGGITACNDNGCLDLGTDVEHRFGFIPVDGGRGQGLNVPPEGLGDEESSGDVGGDGSILDRLRSDMLDEDIVLFIPGDDAAIERKLLPFSGFAVVGQSAGTNPWGTADLLDVEYADVDSMYVDYGEGYGGYRDVWTLKSSTAGGYINSAAIAYGGEVNYAYAYVNRYDYGVLGSTRVFFGSWGNYDYVSLGNYPLQATETLVPNAGLFVVGDWASPTDIATLSGSVSFLLRHVTALDASGYSLSIAGQEGLMNIDMGTGAVSGNIDLADDSSRVWRLLFAGAYSADDFDLSIVTDSGTPENGSYYTPAAGAPMAIAGNIDAAFVGSDGVDGVVGAFSVATTDNPMSASLQGVFGMERDVPFSGFAAVSGSNPWGSTRLMSIDHAKGAFDVEFSSVTNWSFSSPTLDGKFVYPDQQVYVYGQSGYRTLGSNTDVYWGYWSGDDVLLAAAAGDTTGELLQNAGAFVFGREADDAVVQASLTGITRFSMTDGAVVENGVAGSATFGGDMYVTLDSGAVDGKLYTIGSESGHYWSLRFTGSAAASGMNLSIVAGTDGTTTASYFRPADYLSIGDYRGVDGTISASFAGRTEVDGIIGAFDVYTPTSTMTAQGAFVMERDPSYAGFVAIDDATTNPWSGSQRLLDVDHAFLFIDPEFGTTPTDVAMFSSAADNQYINSAALPNSQIQVAMLDYGYGSTVYWGHWNSAEMAVAADPFATGIAVNNPGLFILASVPEASVVQADLTGETSFNLSTVGVIENGSTYYQVDGPVGSMTVNLGNGTASGDLSFGNANGDYWALAFTGNASASGLDLAVTSGTNGVAQDSYFAPFNWIDPVELKGVSGTIQAGFAGTTWVEGVVGAFDVQTLDQASTAQGVFIMDSPVLVEQQL